MLLCKCMENKINEALKLLDEYNTKKVKEFFTIVEDMKLGETKKLEGVLYYCLKANKLTLENIKNCYDEKIHATLEIIDKLEKINYSQQDVEAENISLDI